MAIVSVVIPVYNSEKYLRECLESVFSQSLKDFEIILIDDGSTDGSEKVYKSFKDERLKIYRQENRGVALSRNYAMSIATGEFIACLDSDDIWRHNKLELQYNYFSKHNGCSLVGSYSNVIDAEGNFIYLYDRIPINDLEIRQYIKRYNPIITSAAFFKKEDALKLGGFYDEIRGVPEEMPLWVALTKIGKVHNIPEPLVSNRVVPGSWSSYLEQKQLLVRELTDKGEYTQKRKEKCREMIQMDKSTKNIYYDYYLKLSKLYLFEGSKKGKSSKYLYLAIRLNPRALMPYILLPFFLLPCRINKLIKDLWMQTLGFLYLSIRRV